MSGAATLRLARIRQSFARPVVADLEGDIHATFAASAPPLPSGAPVAVAVGSRGIAGLARIVTATVAELRARGAEPFIVPAMGSHGGATAEGQREILAGLGVTEAAVGCPIRSSLEVAELSAPSGAEYRLFMDRLAHGAHGVVLINRIKPHTDFHARYESGLVKMSVIGLGKVAQAEEMHRHGVRGLAELLPNAAAAVLASGRILLGLAVVENAYDETMHIEAIRPERILAREPELLDVARANMPRLPVDRLDVLVVDRMGKEISGVGMDSNVVGRIRIRGQPEPAAPDIAMIVVSDLTDASHGNAAGMGLADVTTRRMFEKIDFDVTNTNVVTSGFLDRGRVPMVAPDTARAVDWALRACGPIPRGRERVIRIRDTLHLGDLYASPAVIDDLAGRADVEVLDEPGEAFGESGEPHPFETETRA